MTQKDLQLIGGIYRVGQVLQAGPVLTICTAYDRNTNDVVGLCVIQLPPQIPHELLQQQLQSLEQWRKLQSPHVIHVYRWGIEENRMYIATDRPRGVTLHYVLEHENVDMKRALDVTRQIALGLEALHERRIAGMDLRPQHITIDVIGSTDRVQIDDIGLRRLLNIPGYNDSQHHDEIGYLDPRYTPPEYINNSQIGPWSDVYQLGLLLFTMVTGRPPFVGRNAAETGILQSTRPVPSMTQYTHETPEALQDIVNHAMEKDPGRRFGSIQAFLSALDSIAAPLFRTTHEQAAVIDKASQPGVGLTLEMPHVENDMTAGSTKPTDAETTLVESAAETGAYAFLLYEKAGEEARRIPITQKSVIVGRIDPKRGVNPDIDLSTFDTKMTISRQHARIRYEEAFFSIEDLRSRNRTRLNTSPLPPFTTELLQHGDVIFFGSVRLRFEVPGMAPLPPL